MPEAPEVKVITDQLNERLKGVSLDAVEVISGRYQRHSPPAGLPQCIAKLPRVIDRVECKGKFIYFVLNDEALQGLQRWTFIWNTLGMSGRWSNIKGPHSRIRFGTSAGDFFFDDVRNFGTMHFDRTLAQTEKKLQQLGIDLLSTDTDISTFKERLMRRAKKTITETLMDQTITAGVGNYIKCEALYHSEISPHRITGSLANDELERLLTSLVHVMRSSYAAKGHTMSDYRDLTGESGQFKFQLVVYKQKQDPKGNVVKREETPDGRTTHWVPSIQR